MSGPIRLTIVRVRATCTSGSRSIITIPWLSGSLARRDYLDHTGGETQEILVLKRRMFSTLFALATILGLAAPALADEVVDGSTGPGSVYRLVRPSNWNGILLLYAHGYVSKDVPVGITPDNQLVISLLAAKASPSRCRASPRTAGS